jgi:hypothetical protein
MHPNTWAKAPQRMQYPTAPNSGTIASNRLGAVRATKWPECWGLAAIVVFMACDRTPLSVLWMLVSCRMQILLLPKGNPNSQFRRKWGLVFGFRSWNCSRMRHNFRMKLPRATDTTSPSRIRAILKGSVISMALGSCNFRLPRSLL